MWSADANKDIGFKFSLREELTNEKEKEDRDLQLRDFNIANFNQSSASTTCPLNAERGTLTPESQEPNPGRHDTEMEDPVVMIGNGDQQGFNAKTRPTLRTERMKCEECSWEGTRHAYGSHMKRLHGTKPKLARCDECGLKCYELWLLSHKSRGLCQRLHDGTERKKSKNYSAGTCGTCGFKTSNLRSHVLLRHSKKEQYLQEHYNVAKGDEDLKCGYNCRSCGKHFSRKTRLWMHISRLHGVVSMEEISKVAMGKDMSFEKDQTMTELESNIMRSMPAAVVEVKVLIYAM